MKTMQERRPRLSFFPDAPKGASMFAMYVAYHWMSGNHALTATKELLFDSYYGHGCDLFGSNLNRVAKGLPDNRRFDARRLMEAATLFGIYSAALPQVRKMAWQENLLAGRSSSTRTFVSTTYHYGKKVMHFCRECVLEDQSAFGFAFWRVIHQVPGIHHCLKHKTPLSGTCCKCMRPQASEGDWNPPELTCPHCNNQTFNQTDPNTSPAYWRYIELCEKAADGKDIGLLPEKRTATYRKWMSIWSSSDIAIASIKSQILKEWEVKSLEELGSQLNVPFNERFIQLALIGEDAGSNPLGHIAMLACLSHSERGLTPTESTITRLDSVALSISDTKLQDLAEENGIPLQAALAIQSGGSLMYIRKKFAVADSRTMRFRALLENYRLYHGQPTSGEKYQQMLLEKHRNTIIAAVNSGICSRSQLVRVASASLQWCRKHDSVWLDKNMPRCPSGNRRQVPNDQKHNVYTTEILRYLKKYPEASRYALNIHLRTAYLWCNKHARPWLDMVVPSRRVLSCNGRKRTKTAL